MSFDQRKSQVSTSDRLQNEQKSEPQYFCRYWNGPQSNMWDEGLSKTSQRYQVLGSHYKYTARPVTNIEIRGDQQLKSTKTRAYVTRFRILKSKDKLESKDQVKNFTSRPLAYILRKTEGHGVEKFEKSHEQGSDKRPLSEKQAKRIQKMYNKLTNKGKGKSRYIDFSHWRELLGAVDVQTPDQKVTCLVDDDSCRIKEVLLEYFGDFDEYRKMLESKKMSFECKLILTKLMHKFEQMVEAPEHFRTLQ